MKSYYIFKTITWAALNTPFILPEQNQRRGRSWEHKARDFRNQKIPVFFR